MFEHNKCTYPPVNYSHQAQRRQCPRGVAVCRRRASGAAASALRWPRKKRSPPPSVPTSTVSTICPVVAMPISKRTTSKATAPPPRRRRRRRGTCERPESDQHFLFIFSFTNCWWTIVETGLCSLFDHRPPPAKTKQKTENKGLPIDWFSPFFYGRWVPTILVCVCVCLCDLAYVHYVDGIVFFPIDQPE